MVSEPTIIINGVTLTSAQASVVRVAVTHFESFVNSSANMALLGRELAIGYQQCAFEVLTAMGVL